MKVALVTDAWFPQVNGVVTTLNQTATHKDPEFRSLHIQQEALPFK